MRLIFVVAALFCAYLVGNRMAHPFIDGDLFWQRQLGEFVLQNHAIPTMLGSDVFSVPGAPWTPHEWLLGVSQPSRWTTTPSGRSRCWPAWPSLPP